jgi:hypothetical protein
MKKRITKSSTTISIATLVVVFVAAIGLILAGNYQKNHQLPKSVPIPATNVEVSSKLINPLQIDKPYLIDSAAALKQQLKLSAITGFDPENQVLAGVVLSGKPNVGYKVAIESTATLANQVLINYRVVQPENTLTPSSVAAYPQTFAIINRTDLPNLSPVNFVFTNLTDGATQTISKVLGAQ